MIACTDGLQEHECATRVPIYSTVLVATTWGPPLIGGAASQTSSGFGLQFSILGAFFVLAIPAIVLGAPETAFDRPAVLPQTPITSNERSKVVSPTPSNTLTKEAALDYLATMKPHSFTGSFSHDILLQAPRAFVAPTTMLIFVVGLLPYGTLWGLTSSLSLLYAPTLSVVSTGRLGALLTGPWLFSTAIVCVFALLPWWQTRFTPKANMAALAGGTVLTFIGVLTFGGLHADGMTRGAASPTSVSAAFFPVVSFLLGLLAAGAYVLDATARPLVRCSTQFTSSSLGVALRNRADMEAGVGCWRALAVGIFVMALPGDVARPDSLRALCIGVAVAQVVVASLVGAVWWRWDEDARRWDGRVMRLVDLTML